MQIFVRPLHDLKAFSGMTLPIWEFIQWVENLYDTELDPTTTQAVISSIKKIDAEWRYFIVDGKIVTGSMYRYRGQPFKERENDFAVLVEAQALADIWLPHPVCVMDIALCKGEPKVIEFNSFNASGTYDHDVEAIVQSVSEYVSKQ